MADTFNFTTETKVQKVGMLLPAVQSVNESYDYAMLKKNFTDIEEGSFDFTAVPTSDANDIPVDLELVLLNDVSGNTADNKYDLIAVHDGDRTDFAEATTEFTGDYIL